MCVCYMSVSDANFNDEPINEISVFAVLSTQFPYFGFHVIKLYICIDQSWTLQHTCSVNKRAREERERIESIVAFHTKICEADTASEAMALVF